MAALTEARQLAESLSATPNQLAKHGLKINQDGVRRNVLELIAYPDMTRDILLPIWPELAAIDPALFEQLEIDSKYAGYLARQQSDIQAFRRDENLALPANLDVDAIGSLSAEIRQKLKQAKPENLGAAARIPGMTPAALVALLRYVRRGNKHAA